MTKSKDLGIIDTPVDGVTELSLPRAVLNYEQDFRVKQATPEEVVLVNIKSPTARPETFRLSRREINNVYTSSFGKGIAPAVQAATTQGVELLAQWNGTFEETDAADADYTRYEPMQIHAVIKASKNATAQDVKLGLARLISSLFDAGTAEQADAGLEAKLRGALTPKGL